MVGLKAYVVHSKKKKHVYSKINGWWYPNAFMPGAEGLTMCGVKFTFKYNCRTTIFLEEYETATDIYLLETPIKNLLDYI